MTAYFDAWVYGEVYDFDWRGAFGWEAWQVSPSGPSRRGYQGKWHVDRVRMPLAMLLADYRYPLLSSAGR
ncbi:MAG: hypothetical protein E6Q97_12455 [Desulfurellales bacterium]|nr:MAG: hypothetical protein E6Q97_12455 [Desulfurellales bacterium]